MKHLSFTKIILISFWALFTLALSSCSEESRQIKKLSLRMADGEFDKSYQYIYKDDEINCKFFFEKVLGPALQGGMDMELDNYEATGEDMMFVRYELSDVPEEFASYFSAIGKPLRSEGKYSYLEDTFIIKNNAITNKPSFCIKWGVPNQDYSTMSLLTIPQPQSDSNQEAVSVNIRQSASASSLVVGTLDPGKHSFAIDEPSDGEWYKVCNVDSGELKYGYINKNVVQASKFEDCSDTTSGFFLWAVILVPIFIILMFWLLSYVGSGGCGCMGIVFVVFVILFFYFLYEGVEGVLFDWFLINLPG